MKKLTILKTIQLFILLIFLGLCLILFVFQPDRFHAIAVDGELRLMAAALLILFILSLIGILSDLIAYRRQAGKFYTLNYLPASDSNLFDTERENFRTLADTFSHKAFSKNVGAVMFQVKMTHDAKSENVNEQSRLSTSFQRFSVLLKLTGMDKCAIAAREDGVFIALFPETDKETLDAFLQTLQERVAENNEGNEHATIYYRRAVYFHDTAFASNTAELLQILEKKLREAETLS